MKQREHDKKLTGTIPLLDQLEVPNADSLKAIREGDVFMATGKPGRFDNAADLINAALSVPEV